MQALTYIKTVTTARQGFAKPYLVYGQMLPPPAITSPMFTISWSFTGLGSGSANFPAIQHSAWQAPQGSVGIVLTNISSQAISVSVPISFSRLGLSRDISYTVSLADANSTSVLLSQLTSDSAVTISVAPLQVELLKIAPSQPPVVTGVANAAGGQPVVVSGAFVSIYGSNFTPLAYDDWSKSIVNGQLPTRLDGVSVTIGGMPAYISAITPGQINVQAPDVGNGSVQVVVTTPSGASAPFTVNAQLYSPAFFLWPGNQPVATHADYSLAAKTGTFPGTSTVPGKPGEVIVLWGTGFGPTNPPVPAGQVPRVQGPPTQAPVSVTLGGVAVPVLAAVLSSYAATYQIAMQIPTSIANGDYAVVASVNGVQSPSNVLLSVHQ
jgi:uncharacterized protein (TIGR03437 family)